MDLFGERKKYYRKGSVMGQSQGLRSSLGKLSLRKLVCNKFSVSIFFFSMFERMFTVEYIWTELNFYKGILRLLMPKF